MSTSALHPQLTELNDNLEDLEELLQPITTTRTIANTATSLPVADKARLYVLTTYALESLLFSYLRLAGAEVKDHPIRQELSRVRNYVQKIKEAQEAPAPGMALDKDAAKRFINAALAGNDRYDAERAETQSREKKNAHKRFEELSSRMEGGKGGVMEAVTGEVVREKGKKRKSEAVEEVEEGAKEEKKKPKKEKKEKKKGGKRK